MTDHPLIYSFDELVKKSPVNLILIKLWSHSMSRFDEVNELVNRMEEDMDKFYNKGNKAAGTRTRKALQELKKLAQDIRVEIQDMKNSGQV